MNKYISIYFLILFMNASCIVFGAKNLVREEIQGKMVIEVGSNDVNGSLRSIIEYWGSSKYLGIDIEKGPGVDKICYAEDLIETFGKESFDVVISTELLEHVKDWRKVISNIKNICKPGGIIFITTRSYGFPYHGYPYDFWRYDLEDMKFIFADCEILAIENDPDAPGVFIKVKKPENFLENDLSKYRVYNIIENKKSIEIQDKNIKSLYVKRIMLKEKLKNYILNMGLYLFYKF